jgi:hypothetical protein
MFVKRKSGLIVPADVKTRFGGVYHGKLIRLSGEVEEFDFENIVVNQGLNALLNISLGSQAAITAWYLALFSGNYTPVASDTASSISANSSETTVYTLGTRPPFNPATATTQSITNAASQATFTFNATATIYGAFLASSSVINGTSGYLMSAAQFGTSKNVSNGDQLLLTYTLNAASTS